MGDHPAGDRRRLREARPAEQEEDEEAAEKSALDEPLQPMRPCRGKARRLALQGIEQKAGRQKNDCPKTGLRARCRDDRQDDHGGPRRRNHLLRQIGDHRRCRGEECRTGKCTMEADVTRRPAPDDEAERAGDRFVQNEKVERAPQCKPQRIGEGRSRNRPTELGHQIGGAERKGQIEEQRHGEESNGFVQHQSSPRPDERGERAAEIEEQARRHSHGCQPKDVEPCLRQLPDLISVRTHEEKKRDRCAVSQERRKTWRASGERDLPETETGERRDDEQETVLVHSDCDTESKAREQQQRCGSAHRRAQKRPWRRAFFHTCPSAGHPLPRLPEKISRET